MNAITKDEPHTHITTHEPDMLLSVIERVAANPGLPIERLSALLDLQERQMNKVAEQAFNQDFAAAMAEMPDVPRNGKNNHTGQKYSTLDDLIRATRPVLSRHGLSLNWQSAINGDDVSVTAIVRHAQGHQISTTISGQRDNGKQMNRLQGGGSAETYLKRYSGFAILGLSSGDETDNDGRANGQTITAEQFVKLRNLIEKAGLNEDVILKAHGIPTLAETPAKDFALITKRLNAHIEEKAQ